MIGLDLARRGGLPAIAGALAIASACGHGEKQSAGSVSRLSGEATGTRPSGVAGDMVLRSSDGSTLTVAAAPDIPAHRPVRGAVVDVDGSVVEPGDEDPISWWRAAWFDATGTVHPLVASDVAAVDCGGGSAGVRSFGDADGIMLESSVCVRRGGGYEMVTRAPAGLPPGAVLGDEIDAGTATVSIDGAGQRWTPPSRGRFAVISEPGLAVAIEAGELSLSRNNTPGADELTSRILALRYGAGPEIRRNVFVASGDAFNAIARMTIATRSITLRGRARAFDVVDADGESLWEGTIPAAGERTLRLPPEFPGALVFRDERGVPAARAVPLAGSVVTAPPIEHTLVRLRYTDDRGAPLPTHVVFRGLGALKDPLPRLAGRGFQGGRSVYLLDGVGDVALAPGRYRITASHGIRYGLAVQEVTLAPNGAVDVNGVLPEIVRTPDYIAGDLHLHASPSPDSHVTLAERVGALFCEGVDFAVATDHNHVTDYTPAVERVRAGGVLDTLRGEEVTTFSPHWGHFNVFPLAPGGARSAEIVPFFNTTPWAIFADARERGARVIQVNHPRLKPAMGYFDFTHFDPATGRADAMFAPDFDTVEAFNGWNIEHPELVRTSVHDLVGLARRGMHPAATGNSDSHYLLYEEAGYPRTYVRAPRDPVAGRGERVIEGLLAGRTTVSAGPFVELEVQGGGPGALVRPDAGGRVTVHVRVQAPAWVPVENVEVWIDDDVARRFVVNSPPRDGLRFEATFQVEVTRDVVMLAWADAATPLPDVLPYPHAIGVGFTGLIFVDADADGTVSVRPAR